MSETPYMAQRRKLRELRAKQTAGEAPVTKKKAKKKAKKKT
jgi:hypothetical protein